MYCLADLVDHLVNYSGRENNRETTALAVGAARQACQVLAGKWSWNWFISEMTVPLNPSYLTGTVTYTQSNLQLTLSGGVWPSWAIYGIVRINEIDYQVDTRVSNTVLVLSSASNPGSDITTPSTYSIVRVGYQLPQNFDRIYSVCQQPNNIQLQYQQLTDASAIWRRYNWSRAYTIVPDRHAPGRFMVVIGWLTETTGAIQILYYRRLTMLKYDKFNSPDSSRVNTSGTALTGNDTQFNLDMQGAVVRITNDLNTDPTGEFGLNMYDFESMLTTYSSPTVFSMNDAPPSDFTNCRYVISSYLDISYGAMWEYLLRESEKQYRSRARMAPYNAEELMNYNTAFIEAREDDSRYAGLSQVNPFGGGYIFGTLNPTILA